MTDATNVTQDIGSLIKTHKALIYGSQKTMKFLRQGKINRIFLSSSAKPSVKEDFMNYAKISQVELVELNMGSDELGVLCKKPFNISVIGLAK